ncbi:MAG: TRAM domain-containing protein [Candidatus Promineifilaceae bacterium]|nr:TRAM domain-containing protein [Candidatus Promineifilaceae bacterium]
MKLSTEFFFRLVGAVGGAVGGAYLGGWLSILINIPEEAGVYVAIFGLLGFLTGLILTPYVTIRPVRAIRKRLISMSAERLIAIIGGIFLGLIAASLLTLPLSTLPSPFRQILPLFSALVLCYLAIVVLTLRQRDLRGALSFLRSGQSSGGGSASAPEEERHILLDTSVIIDGRVSDICKSGFIRSTLMVPNFVLRELQHIADSADPLRRNRGRRGMDVLKTLQDEGQVPIRFTDMDATDVREVDAKLVALARELSCPIMTNDYNLNRIAELQGVTILNINDLANAVKAVYLPGEELPVKIVQEGREVGQGVAYLDDGTMVVVEDGKNYMQRTIDVVVTKVLQTTAGRMIFARPQGS